ncbi:leucine-rich repeat domain-containing protein, partial [Pseudoflavonifractor sp. 60]|uniref:leucine-rich repeat domain-containing protein n=1 Tax=Pseudoflavonifractor sp. 60 TaxID=2304576 RepID=UPI00136B26E0
MENKQDFAIENGVLTKYNGPGGEVTIPEGVTEIGYSAFSGCTSLSSVTIPVGVTEIGENAFSSTGISDITIPSTVRTIGVVAFWGCNELTQVFLSEGIQSIGESAFSDCTKLSAITIPSSVKEFGRIAFANCFNLREVTILCSLKTLDPLTFMDVDGGEDGIFISPIEAIIVAPCISISSFPEENKLNACIGFARWYCKGREISNEILADYLKYIKGQKEKLYSAAIEHEELLQFMFAENMLARKDIDPLLEECDKQNNVAAKAAVLDYAGRSLEPADPFAEMEKELAKMERQAKRFEKTGQLPASELKKIWSTKKLEDGTLEITSYKGTDTTVSVPAVIGKTAVTAIGEKALSPLTSRLTPEQKRVRETLESVTIPESVTEIGYSAFRGCANL